MKLSEQDLELYFRLMWALQFYVNRKLELHDIQSLEAYEDCPRDQKVIVREALYDNPKMIDAFVRENPQGFSSAELDIVAKWKKPVMGSFFIERLLKKYTVFIQDEAVYGVLGLNQDFDEIIHPSHLPLYVDAVLLPFKGKIVYDGILISRNIYFGGGVKRRLRETYMRAKQNHRIIDGFETSTMKREHESDSNAAQIVAPQLADLAGMAKKLRGSSKYPSICSPAFSLVKASIEFAQTAVADADDQERLYRALEKVRRAYNKSNTVVNRTE